MKIASISDGSTTGLAIASGQGALALFGEDAPGDLDTLLAAGGDSLACAAEVLKARGRAMDLDTIRFLPPFVRPSKIVCVGLNYAAHAAEGGNEVPSFPTLFARFPSSLVGHGQPIIRPALSTKLDYEGELVAVIGKGGKAISRADALEHVAGYSVFNDGSIRDYQRNTPQWTAGKNFDGTGGFGPWFVTADEVPSGASGLTLETRLNGQTVQKTSTTDMIFDVAELVHLLSSFMTLVPGDVLVTGTPSGVGFARKPPLWMKHGDIVEVEIEGVGLLSNPVIDG
jgi:2-keto-4-pentenoate hydratase/2-oxohepta-3-ene-1,7-dioic acid hydratase in catechol pathway